MCYNNNVDESVNGGNKFFIGLRQVFDENVAQFIFISLVEVLQSTRIIRLFVESFLLCLNGSGHAGEWQTTTN